MAYFHINKEQEYAELFEFPLNSIAIGTLESEFRLAKEWLNDKVYNTGSGGWSYPLEKPRKSWANCFGIFIYDDSILPTIFQQVNVTNLTNNGQSLSSTNSNLIINFPNQQTFSSLANHIFRLIPTSAPNVFDAVSIP